MGQQRGRHQHRHLLAVLHRLERRPDRDLGLAVADVAADHPVHRQRLLHVRLDLVDGRHLVGRLDVGEGVLQLALPRGVRAEGVPAGGHPCRVQPDQLGRDLLDRLARPALGLGPVGTAEPRQRGCLAADVLGDLVQGVGRHEQPVAGLALLGRGVLDDQVLALAAVDGAPHHLDVAAHAVLLVHHEVAGGQLDRVDRVAPPGRHPGLVQRGDPALAGEVGLGEDGQLQLGRDQAGLEVAGGDGDHAGLELVDAGHHPGRDAGTVQPLQRALGAAVAGEDQRQPPAVAGPAADVAQQRLGVAAVGGGGLERGVDRGHRPEVRAGLGDQLVVGAERGQRPPRHAQVDSGIAYVIQRAQRRRAEVDGSLAATGGGRPGRGQELLGGGHQVRRPGPDPLGVADQHRGFGRELLEHQPQLVDQHRGQ